MNIVPPDLSQLAQQLAHFLQPFLPYLLRVGERAAEELGRKFGEAAWGKAEAMWAQLCGKGDVKAAAEAVAAQPNRPAARQALVEAIARALEEDPALARALAQAMDDPVVQRVIATGGSVIEDVTQEAGEEAGGGPTVQDVRADEGSTIRGVRQIRR